MTRNQIEYWNLQELKQHNRVTESEEQRANRAREAFNISNLAETGRHNVAQEGIDISKLNESVRHNTATEGQAVSDLQERHRSATAQESLERTKQKETRRSNIAQESEAKRSHQASEGLKSIEIKTNRADLAERKRHNLAAEEVSKLTQIEQVRSNLAKELQNQRELTEKIRNNRVTEGTAAYNAQTQRAKQLADQVYQEAQARLKESENILRGEQNATKLKELTNNMDKWKAELKEVKRRNDLDAALKLIDKIQKQEELNIDIVDTIWNGINGSIRSGSTAKKGAENGKTETPKKSNNPYGY